MSESEPRADVASPTVSSQSMPDRTTLFAFTLFVFLGGGASIAVRFT